MVENRYWVHTGLSTYHYPYKNSTSENTQVLLFVTIYYFFCEFVVVIIMVAKRMPEKYFHYCQIDKGATQENISR